MWLDLVDIRATLTGFITAGGPVLWVLSGLSLLLWSLVLERIWFVLVRYPRQLKQILAHSVSVNTRQYLISKTQLNLALQDSLPIIRTLVVMCPLLGVLGTVTGMIQLFDTIYWHGTGNPRLMAAGVARATLPTLAGIVLAVSGLLVWGRLARWAHLQRNRLIRNGV